MQPPLYKFPITFPTLAWEVIDWIENYLVHGPGDIQGDSIKLDDEECAWLAWAYRMYPRDHPQAGRRMIHRAIYCRPKGFTQERVRWHGLLCRGARTGALRRVERQGDPVGKPVKYPFVRIMATEEDQSSNVYDNVAYMLAHGEVQNAYSVDIGRSVQTARESF